MKTTEYLERIVTFNAVNLWCSYIPLAIPMIPTIAPMIAVIDKIAPETIPKISPILGASPLPARMSTERKKNLLQMTNLVGNHIHVHRIWTTN